MISWCTSNDPKEDVAFPDCSNCDLSAPRHVTSTPRLVVGPSSDSAGQQNPS